MDNDSAVLTYSTRDYWLAGALLASARKLLRLDWHGGRASFVFADFERCEAAATAYWAGALKVSAKAYADGLRTLKDRLHGDRYENYNR